MDFSKQTPTLARKEARSIILPVLAFIALMWLIELIDWLVFRGSLDLYGILPRQPGGLLGIGLAPLLHGDFGHLLANTLPFIVLGLLIRARYKNQFLPVSLLIVVISGLGIWLLGPSQTVHIGASGLIFGYFGFLVAAAYYERSFIAIAVAIVVIVLYGGIVLGLLPQGNGISWQGHLFGMFAGVLAARYFIRRT
ncbi:MAG: rhomboid family intramembrane serine protease [Chloroflexota bacterium]|jgi:membrane associated rhomboid family serine protease